MDPVTVTFYAIVCGALALFAPTFPGALLRIVAGAIVGLGAASVLPFIRVALGI